MTRPDVVGRWRIVSPVRRNYVHHALVVLVISSISPRGRNVRVLDHQQVVGTRAQ